MKKLLATLSAMVLMLSMVGCAASETESSTSSESTSSESTSSSEESSDGEKIVSIAKEVDAISMNSMYATDGMSFETIHNTIDGLMNVDADGNLIAGIAESYTESEDGLVYTFTLRDAVWSNGTAVTAADFVFAWQTAITNPEAEYNYLFTAGNASVLNADEVLAGTMDKSELGIVAIDDYTLEVTLSQRTSYFLSLMAFPVFFPVNEEFYLAQGTDGSDYALTPDNLISCGAYICTNWERDTKIEYVKNEDYWDADAVQVDGLIVNIIPDASASAIAFEAGDVSFTKITSNQIDAYADSDEFTQILDGYLWYLQPNMGEDAVNPAMQNQNFRIALAYATSKEELCSDVLKDGSVPGNGFVPTALATGPDGEDFRETAGDTYATDIELAQEYYAKACEELGVDNITIELMYETADPAQTAATYLQGMLMSNLPGLTVTMNAQSKEARIELQKDRAFDIVLTRWGPDYADPTTYLNLMMTGNSYNYGDWSNAEYDAIMQEASDTADLSTRWELLLEAEAIIVEECPIIAVFQVGGASLVEEGVTGIEVHAVGVPYVYKNINIE
ncbi:MAG: peptide ABC transporter substrate-binding protein [Clostridia bacterium]